MSWGMLCEPVTTLAFSPDSCFFAFSYGEIIECIPTGQVATTTRYLSEGFGGVLAIAFEPGGNGLASGGEDGRLCLWEFTQNEPVVVREFSAPVTALAYDSSGAFLAVSVEGGAIQIWEML